MSGVVSYPEAARVVLEQAKLIAGKLSLAVETVPLEQAAGRVLAHPIRADRDQPPFARSTRDGFACRAGDFAGDGRLKIIGQIRAGQRWGGTVSEGETVEIMTGAPVPPGADCVVMVEHVSVADGWVRLSRGGADAPSSGSNIVPAGTEARSGDIALPPGTLLEAAPIALAASLGAAEVDVFARPRVAILATGDELVEAGRTPLPHQIRNSNSYALAALVSAAGGEPVRLPSAPDDRGRLEEMIASVRQVDLLVLSGGVSMGKYDLVEDVLLKLGAEFFFTGARIQPGKPVVFGRFPLPDPAQYFFGLPGNPVSVMVTARLFVEPLLGALCGRAPALPSFRLARLKRPVTVKPGLTRFLPAWVENGLGGEDSGIEVEVTPVAWHGSGDLAGAGRANCCLVVPEDRSELRAGEVATVLKL